MNILIPDSWLRDFIKTKIIRLPYGKDPNDLGEEILNFVEEDYVYS